MKRKPNRMSKVVHTKWHKWKVAHIDAKIKTKNNFEHDTLRKGVRIENTKAESRDGNFRTGVSFENTRIESIDMEFKNTRIESTDMEFKNRKKKRVN